MWSATRRRSQAWLGTRHVAWSDPGGRVETATVADAREAIERLRRWRANENSKAKVTLWLSGALCALDVVPSVEGVRSKAEAESAAAAWLAAQGRVPDAAMVRLAGWPCARTHWPVAVSDRAVAQGAVEALAGRCRSMQPWWAWALRRVDPFAGAMSSTFYDGEALVTCRLDASGAIGEPATHRPVEDAAAARRIALRVGSDPARRSWTALDWDRDPPKVGVGTTTSNDPFSFSFMVEHAPRT